MMKIVKPTEELLDTINALNTRDKKYTPNESYMATSAKTKEKIDGHVRSIMAGWCHGVTDHFYRESEQTTALASDHTAALAIGIVNSYLTKARQDANLVNIFQDPNQYQLLFMTSLCLSSKITQKQPLSTDLANLSKGKFTAKNIVQFEPNLLNVLGWNLSPPTPYEYFEALAPTIFNGYEAAIKRARKKIKEPLKKAIMDSSQINVRAVDKFYNAMSEVLKSSGKARLRPRLNSALTDRGTLAEKGKLADPKSRIQQRNAMSEVLKGSDKDLLIHSLNSASTVLGTLAEEGKIADPESRIQQIHAMSEVLKSSGKARLRPRLNSALTDRGTLVAADGKLADPVSRRRSRHQDRLKGNEKKENDKKRKL